MIVECGALERAGRECDRLVTHARGALADVGIDADAVRTLSTLTSLVTRRPP